MERGGMKQQAIPFRQKKPGTGPLVDKAEKAPFAPPPPSRTAGAFEQAKPQSHATVAYKQEREDEQEDATEKVLRSFDMDMSYGPCIGLTRLERWHRAQRLGLSPPPEVLSLLETGPGGPAASNDCLWEGRV